jgi:hypothetical protein
VIWRRRSLTVCDGCTAATQPQAVTPAILVEDTTLYSTALGLMPVQRGAIVGRNERTLPLVLLHCLAAVAARSDRLSVVLSVLPSTVHCTSKPGRPESDQ